LTDHPCPSILKTLKANVEKNVPQHTRDRVTVQGHEWGVLLDEFSLSQHHKYTRILCADCLWMEEKHQSLVRSMLHFLSLDQEARAWIIASFHTGRAKLAAFFDLAATAGLEAEEIWERDANGNEKAWSKDAGKGREDVAERAKWLVVAILKRSMNGIKSSS